MPEVMFSGPAGRIEGRFHPSPVRGAPLAIILHPHPQFGGTMNNQIVYNLYYTFAERGFSVLRFNFRGVGRSQGGFDHGQGELSDAAAALDWAQAFNPDEEIISAAEKHHCDAIFMASHGRSGLSRLFLGSKTQRVLAHSTIPVLVLR